MGGERFESVRNVWPGERFESVCHLRGGCRRGHLRGSYCPKYSSQAGIRNYHAINNMASRHAHAETTSADENGGLFRVDTSNPSVRVRMPGQAARALKTRPVPVVPRSFDLFPRMFEYEAAQSTAMLELTEWLGSLPGVPTAACRRSVRDVVTVGESTSGLTIWKDALTWNHADPPPKQRQPGNTPTVGLFKLGKKILKDYVVRSPLGVLPTEEGWRTGEPDRFSYVDLFWKPTHIREGYFPLRNTGSKAECSEVVDRNLHWVAPKQSAIESLGRLVDSKTPGIRKVSEAPAGARLRRRARWVLSLNPDKQRRYLGAILKGSWTPDLTQEFAHPRFAQLVAAREGGLKFLGGGTVEIPAVEGKECKTLSYVNAIHDGVVFRLFPELLAKLSLYATFRARGATLVAALRTRATEWCKLEKLPAELAAETVAPTVAIALSPSAQEKAGTAILRTTTDSSGASPEAEGWWNAAP